VTPAKKAATSASANKKKESKSVTPVKSPLRKRDAKAEEKNKAKKEKSPAKKVPEVKKPEPAPQVK